MDKYFYFNNAIILVIYIYIYPVKNIDSLIYL